MGSPCSGGAAENVIQQRGREANPFKESVVRRRWGRLPRCASRVCEIEAAYVSQWIGKEHEASSFSPLKILEEKSCLFGFLSAPAFSAHGSLLSVLQHNVHLHVWTGWTGEMSWQGGVTSDNEEGAEWRREGGREGEMSSTHPTGVMTWQARWVGPSLCHRSRFKTN